MTDLRKAAEMALRQLNRDDEYLGHRSKTRADAINALRQALNVDGVNISQERVDETAKGEQEPVAWMWKDGTITNDPDKADGTWQPLYTAPPKQWVGLTELELRMIYCNTSEYRDFWEAYSAKLKEKST